MQNEGITKLVLFEEDGCNIINNNHNNTLPNLHFVAVTA